MYIYSRGDIPEAVDISLPFSRLSTISQKSCHAHTQGPPDNYRGQGIIFSPRNRGNMMGQT